MNIVLDKPKFKPLTLAELRQLHGYCMVAEEDGGFYGNKRQYWSRHKNIRAFLEDAINKLEN